MHLISSAIISCEHINAKIYLYANFFMMRDGKNHLSNILKPSWISIWVLMRFLKVQYGSFAIFLRVWLKLPKPKRCFCIPNARYLIGAKTSAYKMCNVIISYWTSAAIYANFKCTFKCHILITIYKQFAFSFLQWKGDARYHDNGWC